MQLSICKLLLVKEHCLLIFPSYPNESAAPSVFHVQIFNHRMFFVFLQSEGGAWPNDPLKIHRRPWYPSLFGLGGTVPHTFQDTGEEFAVIRGDLWRSNYTKTVFGWGSTPDPITRELLSCVVFQAQATFARGLPGLSLQTLTRLYFSC